MTIRPYGLVVSGTLELGLELVVEDGTIEEIRPHTGIPEPFVVCPAFVNAHSHLEYRGFQGKLDSADFPDWIAQLLPMKDLLSVHEAASFARLAADENRQTGVALLAEHSDLPVSAEALAAAGLAGFVFQETITFEDWDNPAPKIDRVKAKADIQRETFGRGKVHLSPHAPYSVDSETLAAFGANGQPFSIHAAESIHERSWLTEDRGPFAAMHRSQGHGPIHARSSVEYLSRLGLCRKGAQFVHVCDVDEEDVRLMAEGAVSVSHCPRSNRFLWCPTSPVRRMREEGIRVGIGMDSAASGGPIDLFLEMQAALDASLSLGEPLTGEEVLLMATTEGAASLGFEGWDVAVGSKVPLIAIEVSDARSTEDLIRMGSPKKVRWL